MNLSLIIKEIGRGTKGSRSLDAQDSETLFNAMLQGQVPDLELGAILLSLRIKGESDEELIGFCRAMNNSTQMLHLSNTKPVVVLPSYNGVRRQPNLLPLLALLLKNAGLSVLIHGRHDFDNRANPFPLFKALDIPQAHSLEDAEFQINANGITVIQTELLNPGLDRLLNLRSRLGVRNSAHTLCKLLDPCPNQSIRVVNITHPEYLIRMSAILAFQQSCAMLMRGTEGEPFANPRRRPQLIGFKMGQTINLFDAEEGGSPPIDGWPDHTNLHDNVLLIQKLLNQPNLIPTPILDQIEGLQRLAK